MSLRSGADTQLIPSKPMLKSPLMATRDPEVKSKCQNLEMLSKVTVTFCESKFWSCKGFYHLQIDDFRTKDGLGLSRSVLDCSNFLRTQCITNHFNFQIRVQKPIAKSVSHHVQ